MFSISPEVYVINFVLAIPIFFVCRSVWRRLIEEKKPRAILTIGSTLILTPLVYVGLFLAWVLLISYHPSEDFDREKWLAEKEKRYELTDDLIDSEVLIGMTKQEVLYLLGDTDTTGNLMTYHIGFEPGLIVIDPSVLEIEFKDGKVIKVWTKRT